MRNINGDLFVNMLVSASNKLENAKESVNKLNVFPVPDGDTGTNMSLTFAKAVSDVANLSSATVGEASKILASSSLRGARGNSGVILSQFLRGISKALADSESTDIKLFALALESGKTAAYNAVMKPTEGTILTIMRALAEKSLEIADSDRTFIEFLEEIIEYGNKVLDETPEMLPKLKQAGVVDAGGKGLMIIFEGMLYFLKNGEVIARKETSAEDSEEDEGMILSDEEITFGYCTEFIIIKGKSGADVLRSKLEKIGDSVVVVEDSEIIKVHVHTDTPNIAIGYGLELGALTSMKIDNMRYQNEQLKKKEEEKRKAERTKYGFLAVAAGEGFKNIYKELGITGFVSGGQSMNPSTEDILKAAYNVNAETVFVFPNNKNIILAAQQAQEIFEGNMIVIPTTSMAQVFPIMLMYDDNKSETELTEEFLEALKNVKTGQVTYAVRDSQVNDIEIKEGDIMAMAEDKVVAVAEDAKNGVLKTLENLGAENAEIITIYSGEDITEEQLAELTAAVEEKYPGCEVSPLEGGQPVYYYVLSVE